MNGGAHVLRQSFLEGIKMLTSAKNRVHQPFFQYTAALAAMNAFASACVMSRDGIHGRWQSVQR
jgi:hypothetical protein